MLRRGAREGTNAFVNADESMAGEIDANGDAQEGVGEVLSESFTDGFRD